MHIIVEKVLKDLINSVNPTDNLTHPDDLDRTISRFKALKKKGLAYSPSEVRDWLIANNKRLDSRTCNRIVDIATEIYNGKRKQIRNKRFYSIEMSITLIEKWIAEL